MTNSQHGFGPLVINCKLRLTEQLQLHLEGKAFVTVCNQQPWVSSLAVERPRVSAHGVLVRACVCGWSMRIRCASVLERLMKSSPKIKVPCGQHSGRAGSKSNLWVPALETPAATQKKRTRDSQTENSINSTADCSGFKLQLRVAVGVVAIEPSQTNGKFNNKWNQKLNPNVHLYTRGQKFHSWVKSEGERLQDDILTASPDI